MSFTGLRDTLTADDQGRFSADTVPVGAHVLEVRAIGYDATRWTLELVHGPIEIVIELESRLPLLDTVRVAVRANFNDPNNWRSPAAFELRRRNRSGQFLSGEQIAMTNARSLGEILRTVPGVYVVCRNRSCDVKLAGIARPCSPQYFLDGAPASNSTGPDFPLHRISGIEVYRATDAPVEFQTTNERCGVIAIWTRMN